MAWNVYRTIASVRCDKVRMYSRVYGPLCSVVEGEKEGGNQPFMIQTIFHGKYPQILRRPLKDVRQELAC